MKKVLCGILGMCPSAWEAFIRTLALCCVMVFCAFMILIDTEPGVRTYELLLTAGELSRAPAGLLLIAALGTVCCEERR